MQLFGLAATVHALTTLRNDQAGPRWQCSLHRTAMSDWTFSEVACSCLGLSGIPVRAKPRFVRIAVSRPADLSLIWVTGG